MVWFAFALRLKNYRSKINVPHFVDKCDKHDFGLAQLA